MYLRTILHKTIKVHTCKTEHLKSVIKQVRMSNTKTMHQAVTSWPTRNKQGRVLSTDDFKRGFLSL